MSRAARLGAFIIAALTILASGVGSPGTELEFAL